VRRAAEAAAPDSGPLAVEVESEIPMAGGLGSSAALIVATAGAVRGMVGGSTNAAGLLPVAVEVEGHPDNVAAALFGGLVGVGAGGEIRSLDVHPSLRLLVGVPDTPLRTAEARRATAGSVETAVAARTAARLLFLIEGLRTGDPSALAAAAGDELHESRRAHLSPITGQMIEAALDAGALHACWSGAGPSVLAVVTAETAGAVEGALADTVGSVLSPGIDRRGLLVD